MGLSLSERAGYYIYMVSSIYKLRDRYKRKRSVFERGLPRKVEECGVEVDDHIRAERLRFSKQLNANLPRSERWFQELYRPHQDINDFFNRPLGNYIPDISNYRFKYVIEIDGTWHDRPEALEKDKLKSKYYSENGYRVIRIRGYCDEDFKRALYILNVIRKKIIKRSVNFDTQATIDAYMKG